MSHFTKRTLALWATAMSLGVAVAALSWFWRYAWLPPGAWEDVAVAAGLHPPEAAFPLLWHAIVHPLFRFFDMAQAIRILRFGGFVSLGLVAMLLMAIFNETLPTAMRSRTQRRAWCRWIVRVVLVQGVVLCVCSDPVWEVGQVFGPAMLHLLMLLGAILVFVRYALRKGIIQGWYWTMLILGVMSGETTLGLLLAVACLFFCRLRAELNADKMQNPLADPFVRTMVMRRMTVIAAVGWLVAVLVNVAFFCMQDGLEAHDLSGFQYSVTYLHNYWKLLTTASSPSGWMLSIIVVLVPFVLSIVHLSVATDDDKFLPYWYAAYFLLVGLVAFLQLAGWQSFWFWTWTGDGNAVESPLLKCCCSFLSAQTFTYALCVLGVEVYFRNYKRIAGIKYQDSVEDTELGADLAASLRRFSRISRLSLLLEPLVMFALVVPYRMQTTTRGIIRALYDFARQTAWESQDARFVFTDGTLDTAVELCAREQRRELLPLSLTGGSTERERFLRGRGALDEEDREMMSYGAVDALRTWLRHKQQRLDDVAVQLGFELWTLAKKPQPPVAGLVARPSGFPPGLAKEGIERAHALVARVLDVYAGDDELEATSSSLRDLFTRMQWRVARMCRMRADILDRSKQTDAALAESQRADDLDAHNASFQFVRKQLEMVGQGKNFRLTPREGMRLGMERADFRMAEMFARQVLYSDPNDVSANFVMGMFYFGNQQYGRAEIYLKTALARKPKSLSILNNLAVTQLRQGYLEEAEVNVRRALEVDPESLEARRTLSNVLKEKDAAKQKLREQGLKP